MSEKRLTLRESHPPYTLSIEEEDILSREPIILERDGQPVAAIVPLAEYGEFRAWQKARLAWFSHLLVLNCSKPRLGASLMVQR